MIVDDGRLSETTRKRNIPFDQPRVVPVILRFAKVRHRQLAVKRAFGRFPPISSTLLEEKYGNTVSRHLDTLQCKLEGYNLREEERKETETALDQLLFMTITFFDDME